MNIKKQDYEMNAFKRNKKIFSKLSFIITGDALYASDSFIKLCLDNKLDYIFRLKSDKLQTVNRDFDGIISIDKGSKLNNYFLVNNYKFNKLIFNIVRYIEDPPPNSISNPKIFTYITN